MRSVTDLAPVVVDSRSGVEAEFRAFEEPRGGFFLEFFWRRIRRVSGGCNGPLRASAKSRRSITSVASFASRMIADRARESSTQNRCKPLQSKGLRRNGEARRSHRRIAARGVRRLIAHGDESRRASVESCSSRWATTRRVRAIDARLASKYLYSPCGRIQICSAQRSDSEEEVTT